MSKVETKELEDRVNQLSASRIGRCVMNTRMCGGRNETLKSLVARYQKELKDQSRSGTGAPIPSVPPLSPAPGGGYLLPRL